MILRHQEPPFTPTEPDQLVRAFEERIARGARWVKVFADWSQDYRGRINSGFSADDELTYPLEQLAMAVELAHERGARVAAHCFTRAGAEVAVRAGVDSLEHGWGIDERLIDEMAETGTAWTPLAGIAASMWRIAKRDREPQRAAWIEASMHALGRLLPRAHAAGVRILAGTDTFPTVTLADEIRQLHELGLDRETALAAGSWAARAWLGEPQLDDGAPADLVVYRSDPRQDLDVLLAPELILVGGVRVQPSLAHVRPRFVAWSERDAFEREALRG
jgi:imidazolonepropionase-like amidohydrolase